MRPWPARSWIAIRRRRECLACGRRFTTYERIVEHGLVVRKRDGTQEPFDREKLRDGIERAATGRLDDHALDALAGEIEEQLRAQGGEVGSTSWILQVMAALGGAVAAGSVAWFLIGAAPQRTYG